MLRYIFIGGKNCSCAFFLILIKALRFNVHLTPSADLGGKKKEKKIKNKKIENFCPHCACL